MTVDVSAVAPVGRRAVSPTAVLLIASLGVFMAFLDDTVVAIAFPNMVRSFPTASIGDLSWVLNAYNIGFAAMLVPAGLFADQFGRRRLYRLGIAVFTIASAACALAPSIAVLVATRSVQGVGAGLIVPASLALILASFATGERTRAVAIWGASGALAAGLGPSIGGLLVTAHNWRLVFLINIPIGLGAWQLSRTHLVESRAPGRRFLPDLTSALLLAVAVGTLTLAIVEGSEWGWTSPAVLGALVATLAAATIFVRRSAHHPAPALDFRLLRMPGIRVTTALTLVGAAGFFGLSLANTLYLMQVWGYSPLTTGLAFTIAPFVTATTAVVTGSLIRGREPRRLIAVGALIWMLGPIALLTLMGTHPNFLGAYLPASILLAIGLGMGFPLVSDAAVSGAPGDRFAGATASNSAIRQIGAAIGIAIVAALVGSAARTGTAAPFHRAWIFAIVCFGTVAVGALLLPKMEPKAEEGADELLERRRALPERPSRQVPSSRGLTQTALRRDTSEALLAEVPMFAELPDELTRAVAARCCERSLPAGAWLFRAHDTAEAIYVLKSGRLEVMGEPLGRPSEVMRTLGRGAVLGELALLAERPRSASVRCSRDATLLELSRPDFVALLGQQPSFASAVIRTLGRQLQESRPNAPTRRASSTTVCLATTDLRGAELESILLAQCRALTSTACLRVSDVGGEIPDDELGHALAVALDAAERDHDLVLLSAGQPGSSEWARVCAAQADRVLLLLGGDPAAAAPADALSALRGCDVALLEEATSQQAVLEQLKPRAIHRIRDGGREDIARLARRLAGRSVGLVLSGGGARSFAHLGVIEELHAAGVSIDRVGAAGMGAFVGGLLAQGLDPVEIDARCYDEWVRKDPLSDYRLPRVSLVRGRRMTRMLEHTLPGLIEDLSLSFYCVAADIVSGNLVPLYSGPLAQAVAASMALPGIVPPVQIAGQHLVDGGVLDGVPIARMLDEADGPIIVSDVTAPDGDAPRGEQETPLGLMETVTRAMLLRGASASERARRHAALYITPAPESVGVREFHMLDRMRDSGRRATLEALESSPYTSAL